MCVQETAYRHADAQALYTVIWLSGAALVWSLLYSYFLLVSVYFTPVTWAVLCSLPMRRAQDKILKSEANRDKFYEMLSPTSS